METTKTIPQIYSDLLKGCGKMFCEDCGSYNAEEEGHNEGCSEGDLGNVYCRIKSSEDELLLCQICQSNLALLKEVISAEVLRINEYFDNEMKGKEGKEFAKVCITKEELLAPLQKILGEMK
jgi:hypothetical protein